jgi:hypothetical protein
LKTAKAMPLLVRSQGLPLVGMWPVTRSWESRSEFFIILDVTLSLFQSNLTHSAQEHSPKANYYFQHKDTVSRALPSSSGAQLKCEKWHLDWDRAAGCTHTVADPAA